MLISNKFSEALLNGGFGLHYNWNALNINVASPILYGTQENKFAQTVLALASYDIKLPNEIWMLKPSVFYRYTDKNLNQVDINLAAEWDEKLWVQAGYRTNNNILTGFGINVKNLNIGYFFEYNSTNLNVISAGTHQIMIIFETQYSVTKKRPLYRRSKRSSWN